MATHTDTKKKKRKNPRAKHQPDETMAIHAHDDCGEHHVVGIGNLRVILVPDGKYWFAQGLEIDYAAQGDSIEDAKKQFEDGLTATVQQHLRMFGNIEKLLKVAPTEAWLDLWTNAKARHSRYSQLSTHEIIRNTLPFDAIDYVEVAKAAVA